jgi:hypothetical protein
VRHIRGDTSCDGSEDRHSIARCGIRHCGLYCASFLCLSRSLLERDLMGDGVEGRICKRDHGLEVDDRPVCCDSLPQKPPRITPAYTSDRCQHDHITLCFNSNYASKKIDQSFVQNLCFSHHRETHQSTPFIHKIQSGNPTKFKFSGQTEKAPLDPNAELVRRRTRLEPG